jgi:hypothetical protein
MLLQVLGFFFLPPNKLAFSSLALFNFIIMDAMDLYS